MATEPVQPKAIFPDLPREIPAINKEGNFNNLWSLGFSSLFQALQDNFKNEGIVFPPLNATQMSTIQQLYQPYVGGTYNTLIMNLPDISGQTVYDTTTFNSNQFIIGQDTSTPTNVLFANWIPFAMMLYNTGNPNYAAGPPIVAAVPGVVNWLCYDTTNKVLYICTQSGSTGTLPMSSPLPAAVWTTV